MPFDALPDELEPEPPAAEAVGDDSTGLFGRFALLAGADVVCRGVRFLADVILGRHFGQAVFGQLNLAQSLAVQGMGVGTCGLDTLGMRDVAAGRLPAGELAVTIALLRLALGVVTWTAVAALAWIVPQYHESCQLTALYGLSIFTGALTMGWVAQARGNMNVVALSILTTHMVYFCGAQGVVYWDLPPVGVPLVLAAAEVFTAAGLWVWLVRVFAGLPRPLPLAAALKILRESVPIGGANVLRGLTVGSDILLLGLFADQAAVGLYSAAFKVYSLGGAAIALYFSVLLPHLAAQVGEENAGVKGTVQRALGWGLLAAAIVLPAAWFEAGDVIRLLFGGAFAPSTASLRILIGALPLILVAGHFRAALVALGRQRLDLCLVAAAAAIHIAGKLALIPLSGANGCALGTLAGEGALAVLAGGVFYKVPSAAAKT